MDDAPGARVWAIAEGYLPEGGGADDRALSSHETLCVLNAGDEDAEIEILVHFADREPAGPYRLGVAARRVKHLRFDDLREPEAVPRGTDFAAVLRASVPVVVQHSRLDSRRGSLALLSTIAHAAG